MKIKKINAVALSNLMAANGLSRCIYLNGKEECYLIKEMQLKGGL